MDAARIDGSSEAGILARVILPLNVSSLSSIGMLTFISLYNSYMWPSIMISDPNKYLISQGLRQFFIQEGAYGMNWGQIMLACAAAMLPIVALFLRSGMVPFVHRRRFRRKKLNEAKENNETESPDARVLSARPADRPAFAGCAKVERAKAPWKWSSGTDWAESWERTSRPSWTTLILPRPSITFRP